MQYNIDLHFQILTSWSEVIWPVEGRTVPLLLQTDTVEPGLPWVWESPYPWEWDGNGNMIFSCGDPHTHMDLLTDIPIWIPDSPYPLNWVENRNMIFSCGDPHMDIHVGIPIWISIWGYPYGDPHVDPHRDSYRNPVGMEIPFPRQP